MAPRFITLTGADDDTDVDEMVRLSKRYRIEWGILLSKTRQGTGRYPGENKLAQFWALAGNHLVLSAHLCGEYSRRVMAGNGLADVIPVDLGFCNRVQVNHAEPSIFRVSSFAGSWGPRGVVQWRGDSFPKEHSVDLLFDRSGGEGKAPSAWPKHPGSYQMVGYAGGIGPDNVLDVIAQIEAESSHVGQDSPLAESYWLDMESGVRTNDHFDLNLCRAVCEQVWPDR